MNSAGIFKNMQRQVCILFLIVNSGLVVDMPGKLFILLVMLIYLDAIIQLQAVDKNVQYHESQDSFYEQLNLLFVPLV